MTLFKDRRCAMFTALLLFLYSLPAGSHSNTIVIPMDSVAPLKNVVTVSARNGDFTSPIAAMNSINDASASNPYLVVIGPGEYDLGSTQLVVRSYVTVRGAGFEATRLVGDVESVLASAAALVSGKLGSSISDLAIVNSGSSGELRIGYYAGAGAVLVRNLSAEATGSGNQGSVAYYIESPGAGFFLDLIGNSSGAQFNTGMWIQEAGITVERSRLFGIGGERSHGVFNNESGSRFFNVLAAGVNSSDSSTGFRNYDANPTVRDSRLLGSSSSGGTNALWVDGLNSGADGPNIAHTEMTGSVFNPNGISLNCIDNYDEDLNPVGC